MTDPPYFEQFLGSSPGSPSPRVSSSSRDAKRSHLSIHPNQRHRRRHCRLDRASNNSSSKGLPNDPTSGRRGRGLGDPADRSDRRNHELSVRPTRVLRCPSPRAGIASRRVYILAAELLTATAGARPVERCGFDAAPSSLQHALPPPLRIAERRASKLRGWPRSSLVSGHSPAGAVAARESAACMRTLRCVLRAVADLGLGSR